MYCHGWSCKILSFLSLLHQYRRRNSCYPKSILTHLSLDKMNAISQTTYSNAFIWMKKHEYRVKFHRRLFLRVQLIILRHWFRWWLGANQAISHYLNQWWPSSLTHKCGTRGDELILSFKLTTSWSHDVVIWQSVELQQFKINAILHLTSVLFFFKLMEIKSRAP